MTNPFFNLIPNSIKGLIFDLDGTLVNSMNMHAEVWKEIFAENEVALNAELIHDFAGVPNRELVNILNDKLGTNLDPKVIGEEKEKRTEASLSKTQAIIPTVEIVDFYYTKLPLAIATGAVFSNAEATLKAINIFDKFNAIVTASDNVKGKPDPEIFLEAANRINVEASSCLVFEDSDAGLKGAKNAGMQTIDVRKYL